MRRTLALFLLAGSLAVAQPPQQDSLGRGRYVEAQQELLLRWRDITPASQPAQACQTSLQLAQAYEGSGAWEKARNWREQAYDWSRLSRDGALQASSALELGRSRVQSGRSEEAVRLLRESELLWTRLQNNGGLARVALTRGNLEAQLGRFDLAEKHYQKAESLDPALRAATLVNRGSLEMRRGRSAQAAQLYQQAQLGASPAALLVQGDVCLQQGQFDQALRLYRQVPDETAARLQAQLNEAQLFLRLGDAPRSLDLLREVVRAHPDMPLAWKQVVAINRAICHGRLGDRDLALRVAQEAPEMGPLATELLLVRAQLDPTQAAQLYPLLEQRLRDFPQALTEWEFWLSRAEWLRLQGKLEAALADLQRLEAAAAHDPEWRFRTAFARARLDRARGQKVEALHHYNQALDALDQLKGSLSTRELAVAFEEDKEPLYLEVIELLLEGGDPQQAFRVSERARARYIDDLLRLGSLPTRSDTDSPARLAADAIYLSYLVGDQQTVLFVQRAGQLQVHRLPIGRAEIAEAVGDTRKQGGLRPSLINRSRFPREKAGHFYRALLGKVPLDNDLRVVICPDGPLYYLPFCLLVDEQGHYLVERHALSYTSSLAAVNPVPPPGNGGALIYADPVVGSGPGPPSLGLFRQSFSALPQAVAEARGVAQLYPQARIRLGAECQEGRFWEDVRSSPASVIHLATHGVANDTNPWLSALLMAPEAGGGGFLLAQTMFAHRMGARLAVLSACQTSLGRVMGGAGMVGLTYAFQQAGVAQVVATQWNLSDATAGALMVAFHKNLASHSVARALQMAQVEALKKGIEPYGWGPFVVHGGD